MLISIATIFVLFLIGTIISGWLLMKLLSSDVQVRDWSAKVCTMSECK